MEFPLSHLEFSLSLHTAHLGTEKVTRSVCGQDFTFPIDLGFAGNEINAMNRVISELRFSGPEPEGEGFVLYSGDGESLRIRGGIFVGPLPVNSLGVELIVKSLDASDSKLDALLRIAFEGNAVLLDGEHACRVRRNVAPEQMSRWSTITRINSTLELVGWLKHTAKGSPVHVPTISN